MGYLGDHPLAANITSRINALAPVVPSTEGLVAIAPSAWATPVVVTTPAGSITIGFDGETGAITDLNMAGLAWADANHPLAKYIYKTYNDLDYDAQVSLDVFEAWDLWRTCMACSGHMLLRRGRTPKDCKS